MKSSHLKVVDEKWLLESAGITGHMNQTIERNRIEKGSDHASFAKSKKIWQFCLLETLNQGLPLYFFFISDNTVLLKMSTCTGGHELSKIFQSNLKTSIN